MSNLWKDAEKPLYVLAPLADVTDPAFRRVIAKYGKPDVMWTEFVSGDGLYHTREKKGLADSENPLMRDLIYDESERPIVAQLFSSRPEMMEYAAHLAAELGFDGIDINMGCPDRSVEKQGAGAALMRTPELARELILAAKRGAGTVPVSVKTRIGYNTDELVPPAGAWLPTLLSAEPALITIHARTRKEMSLVPARWEHVRAAVDLRSQQNSETLIFGNGDCTDLDDARRRVEESGADGAMLGRAIFGNPWLWSGRRKEDIPLAERLSVLVEHAQLFDALCYQKSFAVMRKHFKSYVLGTPGAKELTARLMTTTNADEVARVAQEWCSA